MGVCVCVVINERIFKIDPKIGECILLKKMYAAASINMKNRAPSGIGKLFRSVQSCPTTHRSTPTIDLNELSARRLACALRT